MASGAKQTVSSLKEIASQSYLTAEALDTLKAKLDSALSEKIASQGDSLDTLTERLEKRRAVLRNIVSFLDEVQKEGSVDRSKDPLSNQIVRLGQQLKNLEKVGNNPQALSQFQLIKKA